MRLLEITESGDYYLTEFVDDRIPQYAILSHTWGEAKDEVTFKDFVEGNARSKPGYSKIQFCGKQAAVDGLQYFWIDTCCIDKSSSAELTESINSMFQWYRNAAKCYVYLADVPYNIDAMVDHPNQFPWEQEFRKSRWFSRGWTLQELLAPSVVEFFSLDEMQLGDKKFLEQKLHEITSIAIPALQGSPLSQFSVEERFAWAQNRQTTRKEDAAYSLLGIFDVHMPLIYGEGRQNAFGRLKDEIAKSSRTRISSGVLSEQQRVMLDWLSTSDFPTQQSDLISLREPGTGLWFMSCPSFSQWFHSRKGILYCPGIPGAGKTIIASSVIDHLLKLQNTAVGLAYIYCNYNRQADQTIIKLLAAILKQLLQCRPSLMELPAITLMYEQHSGRNSKPSLQEVISALGTVVKKFSTVYIVVDALDECSDRDGTRGHLLSRLRDLQRETDLRLMFTSRFDANIENEFKSVIIQPIRATDEDVRRLITGQIFRMPKCVQRDLELQIFIEGRIVQAADGM
jgi:Heterokaryon incompatibility protein (HET)